MPASTRIFRESALERLSSPEQLDRLLQVTSPRGWIALAAIWAVLAVVGVWSVVGSVLTRERGTGILVAGGGLRLVESAGAGRLSEIRVGVGETIEAGHVVAVIERKEVEDQLADAVSHHEEMVEQHQVLDELDAREEEHQGQLAEVEDRELQQTIEFAAAREERLNSRRRIIADLVEQGMMTEIDLFEVEEELEANRVAREEARLGLEQLAARNLEANGVRERARRTRLLEADAQGRKVEMLRTRLDRERYVTSSVDGIVVEVRSALHATVAVGAEILLVQPIEAGESRLEAILYVPATTGKRIEVGDVVHVNPSTVKQEQYGSLLGEVTYVADVPTSRSRMMAVLRDGDLCTELTREIGVPLEMHASLQADLSTSSGYAWTSSQGPPVQISAGTLCRGQVTVDKQRPLALVIPGLRKALGAE